MRFLLATFVILVATPLPDFRDLAGQLKYLSLNSNRWSVTFNLLLVV